MKFLFEQTAVDILICTTVPETLTTILKDQPHFLSRYFSVALATSQGSDFESVSGHEQVPTYSVSMVRGISLVKDFVAIFEMLQLLRKVRPALVHSYTPKAGLIAMIAAKLCSVPVRIHTFTGLIFPTSHGWMQWLLKWVDRLICACATHVVPEGQGVKHDLERFRITRKPMKIIGHGNIAGVDTAHFSPQAGGVNSSAIELRAQLGIDPDAFLFCFVGRLNRDKGLFELMSAFALMPPSVHLLVLGDLDKTAPLDNNLLAAIHRTPRVHAIGFVADVRPALWAADVLVLASYREGFPNVILQAGAMMLPVIATDINGCNEVIEPGFNGWLIPSRSTDALCHAMLAAVQTPAATLLQMGQMARLRIQQRFEQKQHWENMLAFYRSLLVKQRFLLVAGFAESLINFRGALMTTLQASGLQVHVAAPNLWEANNPHRLALEARGLSVHNIPLMRTATNPLTDLKTLWYLWRLMRQVRPRFFMGYTNKPVIYGSLAAWLGKVPRRFALITGLGYAFQGEGKRRRLQSVVENLYRLSLANVHKVFFQNPDDERLFRFRGVVNESTPSCLVNGSGVDLDYFCITPLPPGPPRFVLIARLLQEKGVREYALAARRIRAMHPSIQCDLVGWLDANPGSITQLELNTWEAEGTLNFLGYMEDVRPAIAASSVYVLPSYREGTPRTVLEAMAMGRAIITTDAPGCRETVVDGDNGFLVPSKSEDALVAAMERFILEPELIVRMGARSRQIAEEKYDVHKVNAVMLREMGIQ